MSFARITLGAVVCAASLFAALSAHAAPPEGKV